MSFLALYVGPKSGQGLSFTVKSGRNSLMLIEPKIQVVL